MTLASGNSQYPHISTSTHWDNNLWRVIPRGLGFSMADFFLGVPGTLCHMRSREILMDTTSLPPKNMSTITVHTPSFETNVTFLGTPAKLFKLPDFDGAIGTYNFSPASKAACAPDEINELMDADGV